MKTRIYTKSDLLKQEVKEDIKNTLLQGKNVIFPTETVYGIGGYALSEKGIKGIYQVKGRPSDNPLIMHLENTDDLMKYTKNHQPYVQKLIDAYWPGPMTLVFEMTDVVPSFITGGLSTIGIRIPSNELAQTVLNICKVPICAPSANISGTPSSTLLKHVISDFTDRVDIIIDGGKSEIGLESTVIDVTKETPVILRPGFITKQMVEAVTGPVSMSSNVRDDEIPKAPGMKYKHYAPKGNLTIVSGDDLDVVKYIQKQMTSRSVGVITFDEYKDCFETDYVYSIGSINNDQEVASNLFIALREMEHNLYKNEYIFLFC